MRSKRKANRKTRRGQTEQAKHSSCRKERGDRAHKGKTSRSEESSKDTRKAERTDGHHRRKESLGKVKPEAFRAFLKESKQQPIKIKEVHPSKDKRLVREIRVGSRIKPLSTIGYRALLQPFTIVADNPEDKTVVADAGSIVEFLDQRVLYRDRISPVTHRADECLVRYGKPDKPVLGWLSTRTMGKKALTVVAGPTYLVVTNKEEDASAWDLFRLRIGRARKTNPAEWLVSWLVRNGAKYPVELRNVVRLLGGKPIKNEGIDARCAKIFTIILNTEIDMAAAKAAAKKKKGTKKAKGKEEKVVAKKGKKVKAKVAKKEKPDAGDSITAKHDGYVIKRLVQENPRKAGSEKAKIWARIKKGMTVAEFCTKGGTRSAVRRYIENGWIKLLRPKGADSGE